MRRLWESRSVTFPTVKIYSVADHMGTLPAITWVTFKYVKIPRLSIVTGLVSDSSQVVARQLS